MQGGIDKCVTTVEIKILFCLLCEANKAVWNFDLPVKIRFTNTNKLWKRFFTGTVPVIKKDLTGPVPVKRNTYQVQYL